VAAIAVKISRTRTLTFLVRSSVRPIAKVGIEHTKSMISREGGEGLFSLKRVAMRMPTAMLMPPILGTALV
jgi:hypothetical protein